MESLREEELPYGVDKQLRESGEEQAKGKCVYTHVFVCVYIHKYYQGFSYVYEQKHVYLCQCYENGTLILILV